MRKPIALAAALCLCTSVLADDITKQTVTINSSTTEKTVQTITFSGDNVNLTFTDGTTETVDMEAAVLAFEYIPTSISISSVKENGESNVVYDINGRQMRSTLESLPAGIYLIKSADKTVKFVKH